MISDEQVCQADKDFRTGLQAGIVVTISIVTLTVDTMHIVKRLAVEQRLEPVDQLHTVHLERIEQIELKDPVPIAGSGVAVQDHASR
jgi:hypothetical protein